MFTTCCVVFCITIAILVVSFGFAWFIGFSTDAEIDENIFFAWILSSVGFGVCLTYILVNRGVI